MRPQKCFATSMSSAFCFSLSEMGASCKSSMDSTTYFDASILYFGLYSHDGLIIEPPCSSQGTIGASPEYLLYSACHAFSTASLPALGLSGSFVYPNVCTLHTLPYISLTCSMTRPRFRVERSLSTSAGDFLSLLQKRKNSV